MADDITVQLADGAQATLAFDDDSGAQTQRLARLTLKDGRTVLVQATILTEAADGSFRLPFGFPPVDSDSSRAAPVKDAAEVLSVVQERPVIHKRLRPVSHVRIQVTPQEEHRVLDVPLTEQQVSIERVQTERFVDQAPPIRQKADVTIIPILEEVMVVEKRLMVREELHVRRMEKRVHHQKSVTLRREQATITRQPIAAREHVPTPASDGVNDSPA